MSRFTHGSSPALLSFLLFNTLASAQIIGCLDGIDCPPAGCVVGNTTNGYIGATSFDSTISPSGPLSWAVGAGNDDSQSNTTGNLFVKTFYLSTPPTLHLNETSSIGGCALFFEGITKNLPLNYTTEYNTVTCNEVLQAGCVTDLLSQAKQQITSLAASPVASNSSVCSALQSALQTSPPLSCPPAVGGSWGTIIPHTLIGPTAPAPFENPTCRPTTGGKDYQISAIEAQSEYFCEDLSCQPQELQFLWGITPVLTVFYGQGGNSTVLMEPEAHLSCMKIVNGGPATPFMGGADSLHSMMWVSILAVAGALLFL